MSLVLKSLFTTLIENCGATTLCIFGKVTLAFGFLPFLIVYNTFKLLLKLMILVKMRAVFCMNLQNWSCVSLLAATHSQISCALMLEMLLPKLDIPSLQREEAYQCRLSPGNQLRLNCKDARFVCQVSSRIMLNLWCFQIGFKACCSKATLQS